MNRKFCFKRYWLLVKHQWYENATAYKWAIAIIVIGTVVAGWMRWMSGDALPNEYPRFQAEKNIDSITINGPIILMCIYGFLFFRRLSSIGKRMYYFSLPVSTLERVLMAFTFVIVLFPLLLVTIFTVSDFVYIILFNQIHDVSIPLFSKLIDFENSWIITLLFIAMISLYPLGRLIFGKNGLILIVAVQLILAIPAFIPEKTTMTITNSKEVNVETLETVNIVEKIETVTTSVTGKRVENSSRKTSQSMGSFNRMTDTLETMVISENVFTSRKVILGVMIKIFYIVLVPACWIFMYFVMKRKEA